MQHNLTPDLDHLSNLPIDALFAIFSYLEQKDVLNVLNSNMVLYAYFNAYWQRKFRIHFEPFLYDALCKKPDVNWLQEFKHTFDLRPRGWDSYMDYSRSVTPTLISRRKEIIYWVMEGNIQELMKLNLTETELFDDRYTIYADPSSSSEIHGNFLLILYVYYYPGLSHKEVLLDYFFSILKKETESKYSHDKRNVFLSNVHYAIECYQPLKTLQALKKEYANIEINGDIESETGSDNFKRLSTILSRAFSKNMFDVVQYILDEMVPEKFKNDLVAVCMAFAREAKVTNKDFFRILLGKLTRHEDAWIDTLLSILECAIIYGDLTLVQIILEDNRVGLHLGVPHNLTNIQKSPYWDKLVYTIGVCHHLEVVTYLIEKENLISLQDKDKDGKTMLNHLLATMSREIKYLFDEKRLDPYFKMLQFFIEKGACLNSAPTEIEKLLLRARKYTDHANKWEYNENAIKLIAFIEEHLALNAEVPTLPNATVSPGSVVVTSIFARRTPINSALASYAEDINLLEPSVTAKRKND